MSEDKPKFLSEDAGSASYPGESPSRLPVNAPQTPPDHDAKPTFEEADFTEPIPLPNKPLKPRHKEVARLHAMGKTNNEICAAVNYTPAWVSILLSSAPIQAEVDRYRNKLYEQDVLSALKDLGPDAVRTIEEVIRDPSVKINIRADNAKWLIEKLTGKAKQEVNVESNTLASFMEMLRNMKNAGEKLDVMDVTPTEGEARGAGDLPQPHKASKFDSWAESELE